jgi:hypothetical protein
MIKLRKIADSPKIELVDNTKEKLFQKELCRQVPEAVLVLVLDKKGDITPLAFEGVEARQLEERECSLCTIKRFPETITIVNVESGSGCHMITGNGGSIFVQC